MHPNRPSCIQTSFKIGLAGLLLVLTGCSRDAPDTAKTTVAAIPAVQDVIGALKAKANAGDVPAMVELARRYDKGDGIKPDLKSALAWYEKAADKGNGMAAYNAAMLYNGRSGAMPNISQAKILMDRSLDLGYPAAITANALVKYNIELLPSWPQWGFEKINIKANTVDGATVSARNAIENLDRAAIGGDSNAEFLRAMISLRGIHYKSAPIVKPDRAGGVFLLKAAAEKGHWRAALRLATLPEKEAPELTKEVRGKYWKTVEDVSDPDILVDLAEMYFPNSIRKTRLSVWKENTLGEQQAYELVKGFLKRAAEAGSVEAMAEYGAHLSMQPEDFTLLGFKEFTGNSSSWPDGISWLKRAEEKGSFNAKRQLAFFYSTGDIGQKDFAEALRLEMELVNFNPRNLNAISLGMMYANGEGTSKDYVQAYAWFNIAKRYGSRLSLPIWATKFEYLETKLSPEELLRGQELARNWQPGDGPLITSASGGGTGRGSASKSPAVAANGSAVRIHLDGVLLTNQHVVAGCASVRRAGTEKALRILASDAINDLAVVDGDEPSPDAIELHSDAVKLGEDVSTYGFPLSGFLASAGNFTRGQISALSGANNNSSQLQFTAPVQPGSSGGPLLNDYGRLVGLVSSKANALRVAKVTNDIPQNVNFAVSAQTIRTFLTNNKVAHSASSDSWYSRRLDSTKLAEKASGVTIKLECLK